jgi:hypothetical protein
MPILSKSHPRGPIINCILCTCYHPQVHRSPYEVCHFRSILTTLEFFSEMLLQWAYEATILKLFIPISTFELPDAFL